MSSLPVHSIVDDFVVPSCYDLVQILYQDTDIILINKPSGLLSLSGKNPLNWDSVHYRLVHGYLVKGKTGLSPAFPSAKIVHRLDFGTSGIMLVALNGLSVQHLSRQFQAGTIEKSYVALLEGWLEQDQGQITAAIAKDKSQFPLVKICNNTGKQAISNYKVLQRLQQPARSLVQFMPLSGRTHQLRIHSQFIGHPILGCDLYKSTSSQQLAKRLLLHATELSFVHPSTHKIVQVHCPWPF